MAMGPWNLPNPNQQQFDTVTVETPDAVTEVYKYRKGGTSGIVVVTLTLTYTNSDKDTLLSAIRAPQING